MTSSPTSTSGGLARRDLDLESFVRGICNICDCGKYHRKWSSSQCNCGHQSGQHKLILFCTVNGSDPAEGACSCKGYQPALPPFQGRCSECGHEQGGHVSMTARRLTAPENDHRLTTIPAASGPTMSLEEAVIECRDIARTGREIDHAKSILKKHQRSVRGGRGGYRPGSGQKPKYNQADVRKISVTPVKQEPGKTRLTPVGLAVLVHIPSGGHITVGDLKVATRKKLRSDEKVNTFKPVLEEHGITIAEDGDLIFTLLKGNAVPDEDPVNFLSCNYLNPNFIEIPIASSRGSGKRKKTNASEDDERHENISDPEFDQTRPKQPRSSSSRPPIRIDDSDDSDNDSAFESIALARNRSNSTASRARSNSGRTWRSNATSGIDSRRSSITLSDTDNGPDAITNTEGDMRPTSMGEGVGTELFNDDGPSTSAGTSSMIRNTEKDAAVCQNLAEIFCVSSDLVTKLGDYFNSDSYEISDWLQEVTCDGQKRVKYLLDFFLFYAFGVRNDDVYHSQPKVPMFITRFESMEDDHLRNEMIRQQISDQWMKKPLQNFSKLVTVKLFSENGGERGVGIGVVMEYLDMLRNSVFKGYMFEGAPDMYVPNVSAELMIGEWYEFGGRLMANIARHGEPIISGLSEAVKHLLRGGSLAKVPISFEMVPDIDRSTLLQKVISRGPLDDNDRREISQMIVDAGIAISHGIKLNPSTSLYEIKSGHEETTARVIAYYLAVGSRDGALRQIVGGFNEICHFTDFYRLGMQHHGTSIMEPLFQYFFPPTSFEITKKSVLREMIHFEMETVGEEVRIGSKDCFLNDAVMSVIEQLDEDPQAEQSTTNFIRLMSSSRFLPSTARLIWRFKDHPESRDWTNNSIEFHTCFKTADVSSGYFPNRQADLIRYILSCVRSHYAGFAIA